jgi:ATP-dependent Clp protease ATP-binding subunit ClpA
MARLIQTDIKRVLADEILFGKLKDGGRVEIDVEDGALTFDYAPAPEGSARVTVEEAAQDDAPAEE